MQISEVPALARYLEVSQAELLSRLGCDLSYEPAITIADATDAVTHIMRVFETAGRIPTADQLGGLTAIVLKRWLKEKEQATGQSMDDLVNLIFEIQQTMR